jgi:hypothetical protein
MDEIASGVEGFVVYAGKPGDTEAELRGLRDRLSSLEANNRGTSPLYAPRGGVFSSHTDGYEEVTPAELTLLSPSSLESLFPRGRQPEADAAGKLISGIRWYYAAVLDSAQAAKLGQQSKAEVAFPGVGAFEMSVSELGREENGKTVVIFVSGAYISDIANIRRTRAEITISERIGLRIPKAAMRLDDDNRTYVFLLTGVRAERADVEIIGEYEGDYTVRDGTESGSLLRSGSEIIVKANNVYDGKVVLE